VHSDNSRRQRVAKRRTQTQANFIKTSLLKEFPNIDASKVRAIGFGGDRPVASNATREGKAKNRRIDLILGKE
jgi:OOP family OmpA-OmpF porin